MKDIEHEINEIDASMRKITEQISDIHERDGHLSNDDKE